jgi:hypothetical protein
MEKKSYIVLVFILAICITVSSLNSYGETHAVGIPHPQVDFTYSPPSALNGTGLSIDLLSSVNGWQSRNWKANNTLPTCHSPYRNASFTQNPPTGFSVAWQNLSVSKLTAVADFREVQYAATPTSYVPANKSSLVLDIGMRFNLVDTVNLTTVWMYYYSNDTATLQLVTTRGSATTTPQGGKMIASCPIPIAMTAGWHEVKLNSSVNLASNNYYWIIVNTTSMGSNKIIRWGFIDDPGSVPDNKPAAVYITNSWQNETQIHATNPEVPYFNLMLVLKVLPVVAGNPSKVMTYSSPSQVNMKELNSGKPISGNVTRIPAGTHKFILATNTSVTFLGNWTAGFNKYAPGAVETLYTAQPGLTYWTALFTSEAKPSNPYMWYNRTLTIMQIPPDWQIDNSDVTNDGNINYTASYTYGSGNVTILQTDNVSSTSVWDAD